MKKERGKRKEERGKRKKEKEKKKSFRISPNVILWNKIVDP